MKAKHLKNAILQMAVQGTLVPQDPSDEPASVLLERIREKCAELIKKKKIKAPKGGESVIYRAEDGSYYEKRVDARGRESEPVCIDDEIPFEIPETWEWARLGEIGNWKAGATPAKLNPKYHQDGDIPWLLTGDLNDSIVTEIPNKITKLAVEECSVRVNPIGAVLVAMYGATIGKFGILGIPSTTNQACCACILHNEEIRDWLVTWLMFYKPYFKRLGEGGAQPNISRDKIISRLLPVPPLAEQHRIAKRVAELMPLVEEYGKLETAREKLDTELPDKLHKSILQMAVQGTLVPQDHSDEPASALLKRIREERAELITEKKIKAPKGGESIIYRTEDGSYYEKRVDAKGHESESVCIDGEIPFEIPESWEWARLGGIVNITSARRVHQSDWKSSGIPFYRAREIVKLSQGLEIKDALYISKEHFEKLQESGVPEPGDLMVTGVGTIGTTYIVKPKDRFYYKDASVLCFENRYGMQAAYLQLLMQSSFMMKQIREASSGTTVATITMKNAVNFLIPVPPCNEQKLITTRYKELIPLIEGFGKLGSNQN